MISSFRSARGYARVTAGLLILQAVACLAALLFNLNGLRVIRGAMAGHFLTPDQAKAIDDTAMVLNWTGTGLFLFTALVFCLWIYRAHSNLPALGATGLAHTPAWAAGGFFVPFICLYRPLQVMQEIWKASDPTNPEGEPTAWTMRKATPALGWWWACWLLRNFVSQIGKNVGKGAQTPHDMLTMLYFNLAGQLLMLAGIALIVWLVLQIDRRQEELHQAVLTWEWQTVPAQPEI